MTSSIAATEALRPIEVPLKAESLVDANATKICENSLVPATSKAPGPLNTRIYSPFDHMNLGQFRTQEGQVISSFSRASGYVTVDFQSGTTAWSTIKPQATGMNKGIRSLFLSVTAQDYERATLYNLFSLSDLSPFLAPPTAIQDQAGINFIVKAWLSRYRLIGE